MCGSKGPKAPDLPPAAPPLPTPVDPSVINAADETRRQERLRKGFTSTLMNGPAGDLSQPNLAVKTLLGS